MEDSRIDFRYRRRSGLKVKYRNKENMRNWQKDENGNMNS